MWKRFWYSLLVSLPPSPYCTILHCTLLYYTVPCCTVLYNTVKCMYTVKEMLTVKSVYTVNEDVPHNSSCYSCSISNLIKWSHNQPSPALPCPCLLCLYPSMLFSSPPLLLFNPSSSTALSALLWKDKSTSYHPIIAVSWAEEHYIALHCTTLYCGLLIARAWVHTHNKWGR
jgi:hypothetical protein